MPESLCTQTESKEEGAKKIGRQIDASFVPLLPFGKEEGKRLSLNRPECESLSEMACKSSLQNSL